MSQHQLVDEDIISEVSRKELIKSCGFSYGAAVALKKAFPDPKGKLKAESWMTLMFVAVLQAAIAVFIHIPGSGVLAAAVILKATRDINARMGLAATLVIFFISSVAETNNGAFSRVVRCMQYNA